MRYHLKYLLLSFAALIVVAIVVVVVADGLIPKSPKLNRSNMLLKKLIILLTKSFPAA